MARILKGAARKAAPLELTQEVQNERRRIAEHLIQVLREAGYGCELAEDGPPRALTPED